MIRLSLLFCLVALIGCAAAQSSWTVTNITKTDYVNEPLKLGLALPGKPADQFTVTEDGRNVPFALFAEPGSDDEAIWVLTDLKAGASHTYKIGQGQTSRGDHKVRVTSEDGYCTLDNGQFAIRVSAGNPRESGVKLAGPIQAIRLDDKWVGRGGWSTSLKPVSVSFEMLADGEPFARTRLIYQFRRKDDQIGQVTVDVTLAAGWQGALIQEYHQNMPRGTYWTFEMTEGFKADNVYLQPFSSGPSGRGPKRGGVQPISKNGVPDQPAELLIELFPRWNQHYKDGWFAAAVNEKHALAAMVTRASKWYWMHDNAIQVVTPDGQGVALRCPTWRGSRYWFLLAGERELAGKEKALANRYGYEALNTITHAIELKDWPGAEGSFRGYFPLTGNINPTGFWRGLGRRAVREAGKTSNSIGTLTHAQWLMHPDVYGSYWLMHSPENPNFFTDYIKVPIAMTARLRKHPQFDKLAKMAEQKLHEDLYHSVTLPGGAGQECPGYLNHAIHQWQQMAPMCKKYLNFDPTKWPRYQAAQDFLVNTSQPIGGGKRRIHPGGDTHPTGPEINGSVKGRKTEDFPGFGVIFRNHPGTDKETYLAFKSGPNRGHYHGDQLSFHYCAHARPVAIDHMCSYSPRAGQEHMHNRVAFHTKDMPFANMDGYERTIALQTGSDVDIAIGQVESPRIRKVTARPPEKWHQEHPQVQFEKPLTYRRTIVQLKNKGEDYFVIRDQYAGQKSIKASWMLHVKTNSRKRDGAKIEFGNLNVFVAHPKKFDYDTLDWSFQQRGYSESTQGVRLTSDASAGEFITVLHPGKLPPCQAIDGGVKVGGDEIRFAGGIDDVDSVTYVTVIRDGKTIATLTGEQIEMNRSQGEVGLFVPDAGYPFGPIPEWLAKQRLATPDWAPEWAKKVRK
ncbi:MAG: heparinase II/III domain-containing protein [Planctomycetota bacterium]